MFIPLYSEVHAFAPNPALNGDTRCIDRTTKPTIETIKLENCLVMMKDEHLFF